MPKKTLAQSTSSSAAAAAAAAADDKDVSSAVEIVEAESQVDKKRLFTRELRLMMYGFGDVPNPLDESVAVMEELVIDYITELVLVLSMLI